MAAAAQSHTSVLLEHPDKTVMKVSSFTSPKGQHGEKFLATGKKLAMRLWENEQPMSAPKPISQRDYEVVGYVISGRAELHIEGQLILLEAGDSWMVPAHAHHTYKILEAFTAVEATSPPHFMYGRDKDDKEHVQQCTGTSSASKQ